MTSTIGAVVFDCAMPNRLQEFWAAATGYRDDGCGDGWAALADPAGKAPELLFQKVPEGKVAKNRLHIDLSHADPEAEASRLEPLGAVRVKSFERWVVMQDPEGNEFCIVRAAQD